MNPSSVTPLWDGSSCKPLSFFLTESVARERGWKLFSGKRASDLIAVSSGISVLNYTGINNRIWTPTGITKLEEIRSMGADIVFNTLSSPEMGFSHSFVVTLCGTPIMEGSISSGIIEKNADLNTFAGIIFKAFWYFLKNSFIPDPVTWYAGEDKELIAALRTISVR